jgi:ferrous iron transport protein A
MPLSLIEEGKVVTIQRINGKSETKQFLEKLGFVIGASVKIVSSASGNLIVEVKGTRVAVGKDMAAKIIVI